MPNVSLRTDPPALLKPALGVADVQTFERRWAAFFKTRSGSAAPKRASSLGGYFLCMTPRSGSTWLAELLDGTGSLGHPSEYLAFEHPFTLGTQARDLTTYLAEVKQQAATPNGVFGIKGNFVQFAPLMVRGLFTHPDQRYQYIYLTREDVVLQAISLHRAAVTGSWTRGQKGARPEPSFDAREIQRRVEWLLAMQDSWERAFAAYGILPLRMTYEQLERDPVTCVLLVARHVGVEIDPPTMARGTQIQRQRTDVNEDWAVSLAAVAQNASADRVRDARIWSGAAADALVTNSPVADPPRPGLAGPRGAPVEQAEVAGLVAERIRLTSTVQQLSAELELIRGSTSWRATGPMREMGRHVPHRLRRWLSLMLRT